MPQRPDDRPKVAMFVLNPCHADARVRREAATLGREGYRLRVYALGNSTWPEAVIPEDGFEIHRVEVRSVVQRLLGTVVSAAERLGLAGRAPEAASAEAGGTPEPPLRRRIGRRGYRALRRLALPIHRPSVIRRFWAEAGRRAEAWGPDVVHAHDLNTLPAALAAAGPGTPVVYDTHELWRKRNRHGQWRPVGRSVDWWMERRLIGRADLVITVSEGIAAWLEREYAISRPLVLRNVPERLERPGSGASLREAAGLDDGARILLYTGRITSGRGLEEALSSLGGLPSEVHLVLLGYGDEAYVESIRRRARRLGVAGRMRIVPAVEPDMVAATAAGSDAALVHIQPRYLSYHLALPNKLFEGVQARVPVVASDLPEIRRVVERYRIGELFDPDDSVSLSGALRAVLAAPERYAEGLERAAAELVWEREARRLVEAYRRLVDREPAEIASSSSER